LIFVSGLDDSNINAISISNGEIHGKLVKNDGRSVGGYYVELECFESDYFRHDITDKTGRFSFRDVPTGECQVLTMYDGRLYLEDVYVVNDKVSKKDLVVESNDSYYMALVRVILGFTFLGFLSLILFSYIQLKKRTIPEQVMDEGADETKKYAPIRVTQRMQEIIAALPERQKKIIDLLIEYDGVLNSAEIIHYIEIPKATLSRELNHLEQQKIIDTVHVGRNRRVRFTGWFLSGDKN